MVIPVYNEGENILQTLRSFFLKVKTDATVYLVYDYPGDTTVPVIQKHAEEFPSVVLLKNKYGRGVLNALKAGLEDGKGDAILVTMGDGSDDYRGVDEMYKKIAGGAGVVCGSRYVKGGEQRGGPRLKRTLSRWGGVSLHYLSGIPTHDISNSFKMYSRRLLDEITIESTGGFEIGMEITIKGYLKGYRVEEVPTIWTDRAAGKSNFKLAKWLPKYLYWYFYLLKRKFLG